MSPTGHCADRQLALLAAGPGTINTAAPGSPPTVVSQPSTREQQQQTILLFRTKYFYKPHKYFCRHDGCEDRRVRPGHEQHQPGRRGELAEDAASGPAAAGQAHPAGDHPRGHPLHSDATEQIENEGKVTQHVC